VTAKQRVVLAALAMVVGEQCSFERAVRRAA
jgi:hypothetical protein